uniref:L-aminoadipate-semialdehyde dehydrogenase-phosphopantetheinyl transferase n=1 Tax=Eptatretus burgeri TaxID=7764 RepID=A0A8C4Q5F8_EPTBU
MGGLRWAFNTTSWQPTYTEWLLAARCVQAEEKQRIGEFVFARDAKAAMVKPLTMHKMLNKNHRIPKMYLPRRGEGSSLMELNRVHRMTTTGSAEYVKSSDNRVQFVHKHEDRRGSLHDYFQTMSRQFTSLEWKTIKGPASDVEKLELFYRHWCLKESYLKALGVGLGWDLQRLEFRVPTRDLRVGTITRDTTLLLDGTEQNSWEFQETMLDETHFVAVAVGPPEVPQQSVWKVASAAPRFSMLSFRDLMASAIPMFPEDPEFWQNFQEKLKAQNTRDGER